MPILANAQSSSLGYLWFVLMISTAGEHCSVYFIQMVTLQDFIQIMKVRNTLYSTTNYTTGKKNGVVAFN